MGHSTLRGRTGRPPSLPKPMSKQTAMGTNAANYPESKSDTTDKPGDSALTKAAAGWTPALFAAIIVPNIVHEFLSWPWWTVWMPWWVGTALFGVYMWVKRQRTAGRREAPTHTAG